MSKLLFRNMDFAAGAINSSSMRGAEGEMGRQGKTGRTGKQQSRASHTDNRAYVEGNTVRKLDTLPEYAPREKEEHRREKRVDRATRANRQRALQMGPGYVLFLAMALAVTLGIGTLYVQLQSDITGRMRNVSALKNQILDMKTDNDAALRRVEASVNLDEIRNAAINELGMVYPVQGQIENFEVKSNDYMNQYQDIPEK